MTIHNAFTLLTQAQQALAEKLKTFGEVEPRVIRIFEQLQRADQQFQANQWAQAAATYGQVAQLAAQANQKEIQAQACYAQGGMLAVLPDQRSAALEVFQQSAELFAQVGNLQLQQQAEQQMEQLRKRLIDQSSEVQSLTEAIAQLNPQTQVRQILELYHQRARLYLQGGQWEKASRDIQAMFTLAGTTEDLDLLSFVLSQFSPGENSESELLSPVFDYLAQSGQGGENRLLEDLLNHYRTQIHQLINLPDELFNSVNVDHLLSLGEGTLEESQKLAEGLTQQATQLNYSALYQIGTTLQFCQNTEAALQAGQWQTALDLALQERQQALEAKDPQRYFRFTLASLVLAQAYEGLDDRPATIEVLLNCKKTLEHYLGKTAGQPILELLNGLEGRWGKEELLKARLIYREQMQKQGKYRLDD
ncbi:hypothetical protein K4A83_07255 [Spirulina subsalsa FACHB-351]|uniref:Uncharacterized protein n=1 Tax=Spirulina subsalsa FACHB-351 TaxID=234711 RepID=A0ABT3L4Q1_9CYAN|nr:hypothetical protein [Spirulina subsalsa]MCW6036069.1 hypothetical protein [Spirulina subsalsa FACHB-351]